MNPQPLLNYLNDIDRMSPALEDRLLGALEFTKRVKKDFFLREGETNTHIYFLLTGLVRIYHLTPKDKEVTSWLLTEGNIFISVHSFFLQQPSFENIVAVEDCEAVGVSFRALNDICRTHPEFNKHQVAILRRYYAHSEDRKFKLMRQEHVQRYETLLNEEPELLQRATAPIIASYLNFSESSLKRARSDYMNGKGLK